MLSGHGGTSLWLDARVHRYLPKPIEFLAHHVVRLLRCGGVPCAAVWVWTLWWGTRLGVFLEWSFLKKLKIFKFSNRAPGVSHAIRAASPRCQAEGWKPEPRLHPDTWAGKRFRDPRRSRPYKTYKSGFCRFCRVGNSTYEENLRSFGSTQRPNTPAPIPSPRAQAGRLQHHRAGGPEHPPTPQPTPLNSVRCPGQDT